MRLGNLLPLAARSQRLSGKRRSRIFAVGPYHWSRSSAFADDGLTSADSTETLTQNAERERDRAAGTLNPKPWTALLGYVNSDYQCRLIGFYEDLEQEIPKIKHMGIVLKHRDHPQSSSSLLSYKDRSVQAVDTDSRSGIALAAYFHK